VQKIEVPFRLDELGQLLLGALQVLGPRLLHGALEVGIKIRIAFLLHARRVEAFIDEEDANFIAVAWESDNDRLFLELQTPAAGKEEEGRKNMTPGYPGHTCARENAVHGCISRE
jgi:hypothetical protein